MSRGRLCLDGGNTFLVHLATDQYLPSDSFFCCCCCSSQEVFAFSETRRLKAQFRIMRQQVTIQVSVFLNKKCNAYLVFLSCHLYAVKHTNLKCSSGLVICIHLGNHRRHGLLGECPESPPPAHSQVSVPSRPAPSRRPAPTGHGRAAPAHLSDLPRCGALPLPMKCLPPCW